MQPLINFSRSSFDLGLGEPTIIFETKNTPRLTLIGLINVYVGTGGATLSLDLPRREGSDRFPSGLLIACSVDKAVGIIADDYLQSGRFGILESETTRVLIADGIAERVGLLSYDNSMEILG